MSSLSCTNTHTHTYTHTEDIRLPVLLLYFCDVEDLEPRAPVALPKVLTGMFRSPGPLWHCQVLTVMLHLHTAPTYPFGWLACQLVIYMPPQHSQCIYHTPSNPLVAVDKALGSNINPLIEARTSLFSFLLLKFHCICIKVSVISHHLHMHT